MKIYSTTTVAVTTAASTAAFLCQKNGCELDMIGVVFMVSVFILFVMLLIMFS